MKNISPNNNGDFVTTLRPDEIGNTVIVFGQKYNVTHIYSDLYTLDLSPFGRASSQKITHLNEIYGLEHLKDLTMLTLSNNDISDISDLKKLEKLELLFLDNNPITNIDALVSLKNLSHLALCRNNIKDYSPLKKMTQLKSLNGENVDVTSVQSIADIINKTDHYAENTEDETSRFKVFDERYTEIKKYLNTLPEGDQDMQIETMSKDLNFYLVTLLEELLRRL